MIKLLEASNWTFVFSIKEDENWNEQNCHNSVLLDYLQVSWQYIHLQGSIIVNITTILASIVQMNTTSYRVETSSNTKWKPCK